MKTIFVTFVFLSTLLAGCGRTPTTTGGVATTPVHTPPQPTVHLKASNMGNISQINFQVILPTGTTKNLLDYNGQATITGTVQSTTLPCIKSSSHFNCKAQLSVGNISAGNCNVGGQAISMLIVLLRGQKTQESYSIGSIITDTNSSCFFPKTQ